MEKLTTLCFDQAGCRMIQKKLENMQPGESAFASALIHKMLPIFSKAACNQFGNYLCQRVIEICSVDELKSLIYSILPCLLDISLNQHGTRAIQILIEAISNYWHKKNGALHYELLAIVE